MTCQPESSHNEGGVIDPPVRQSIPSNTNQLPYVFVIHILRWVEANLWSMVSFHSTWYIQYDWWVTSQYYGVPGKRPAPVFGVINRRSRALRARDHLTIGCWNIRALIYNGSQSVTVSPLHQNKVDTPSIWFQEKLGEKLHYTTRNQPQIQATRCVIYDEEAYSPRSPCLRAYLRMASCPTFQRLCNKYFCTSSICSNYEFRNILHEWFLCTATTHCSLHPIERHPIYFWWLERLNATSRRKNAPYLGQIWPRTKIWRWWKAIDLCKIQSACGRKHPFTTSPPSGTNVAFKWRSNRHSNRLHLISIQVGVVSFRQPSPLWSWSEIGPRTNVGAKLKRRHIIRRKQVPPKRINPNDLDDPLVKSSLNVTVIRKLWASTIKKVLSRNPRENICCVKSNAM